MSKDYSLFNGKTKTKTTVEFYKDQIVITGKMVSHEAGVYDLEIHGKHVHIKDEEVDHVDPTEQDDVYKMFLNVDLSKTVKAWRDDLAMRFEATVDTGKKFPEDFYAVEHSEYDMRSLIDQLYEHANKGLRKFYKTGEAEYPYYPLAYLVVMDLMNKMFGGFLTVLVGSSPLADVMVLLWLHGYLTSSAVRKQCVKTSSKIEAVSDEVIKQKKEELEKVLAKVADTLQQYAKGELKLPDEDEKEEGEEDDD